MTYNQCIERVHPIMAYVCRNLKSKVLPLFSQGNRLCSSHISDDGGSQRLDSGEAERLTDAGIRKIFTEEHDMFRGQARRFFREEMLPLAKSFGETGYIPNEHWLRAGELGMIGVNIPVEYGGTGGNILHTAVHWEEYAYTGDLDAGCGFVGVLNNVLPYFMAGNEDQRNHYLPRLCSGEIAGSIGFTEPHAGSDLQAIKTNARKDGDDWVLNGSKIYISNGYCSNVSVVAAITNPEAKTPAQGMTLFFVDMDRPGVSKGKPLRKIGFHAFDTCEQFFEDVRLPKEAVLGEVNKGFFQIMKNFNHERTMIAGFSLAAAEWLFEATKDYVINRKAFGRRVADMQVIQHKLAEMKTEICMARSFFDECIASYHLKGSLDLQRASMAKFALSELANKVAYDCVQLHGGAGYMWEYPVARLFAALRVGPIFGGTTEIMKEVIGRQIVKSH